MWTKARCMGAVAMLGYGSLVDAANVCSSSLTLCQPAGATATSIPGTGPELAPLYSDLLSAVKGVPPPSKRGAAEAELLAERADGASTCCNSALTCLNLPGFNVPMCYDRFTTNFFLADGSTGTIDNGGFSGADKGTANLQNGSYSAADGSSGNMYAAGGAASYSPTDSAAIPTPYTASGVGAAIPISALGGIITFVATIPGTTEAGTTIAEQTAPSTVPGTTIPGTTIPAHTTVITSVVQAAPSSTSKGGAAGLVAPRPTAAPIVGGIVGVAAAAALFL